MTAEPDWGAMVVLAEKILSLAPWETFFEDEIFALQTRENGPVYFVSIMGSEGEHRAIAFYPGQESLAHFRRASQPGLPTELLYEHLILNRHLQVTFEQRHDLLPSDLAILKRLGKKYRGTWPAFRGHRPARIPWTANAEEAIELHRLMEGTLAVLSRDDEDFTRDLEDEHFFLRTWDGRDSTCSVSALPATPHSLSVVLPEGALDGLPRAKARFELDLLLAPAPVNDVPKGEPPYFPFLLLLADSGSGMIVGVELISTLEGVDPALSRIPEILIGLLKAGGCLPDVIVARHPILLSLLKAMKKAYGIDYRENHALPAIHQALASLLPALTDREQG